MAGKNGHDNGQDPHKDDDNIAPFPSEKERKILIRKQTAAANDERQPILNLPQGVKLLSLLNVAIYAPMLLLSDDTVSAVIFGGGFVSGRYTGVLPFDLAAIVSPLTYLFLHGSILHLGINVGTLMAFGTGLEKAIGLRKMLALYFLTGFAGALAHFLFYPYSTNPLIGASGAVSGLFGGVLMMMYFSGALGQGVSRILPLILVWLGITLFFGFFSVPGSEGPIGWAAHLGGFLAGLALFRPLLRTKLLD